MDYRGDWLAFRRKLGARLDSRNHRDGGDRGVDAWLDDNSIEAGIAMVDDGDFAVSFRELKMRLAFKIVSDTRGATEEDVEAWLADNGVETAIDLVEG